MVDILKVTDDGKDRLTVTALLDDGTEAEFTGWASATTNHYPADKYTSDGSLKANATARAMTDAEKTTYWLSLCGVTESIDEPEVIFVAAPEILAKAEATELNQAIAEVTG